MYYLSRIISEEFLLRRARLRFDCYDTLRIALRYFSFGGSPGKIDELTGCVAFHLSVSVPPSLDQETKLPVMTERELTVLRLLANPDRIEMLRLMATDPMSSSEVAKELQLHVGSTFRDVNNMYNAGLLLLVPGKGKNRYCTNLQLIENITAHLNEYLQSGRWRKCAVGFIVLSAVSKRSEKRTNRFEDFVRKEYGEEMSQIGCCRFMKI